jgi:hypothetical protein
MNPTTNIVEEIGCQKNQTRIHEASTIIKVMSRPLYTLFGASIARQNSMMITQEEIEAMCLLSENLIYTLFT